MSELIVDMSADAFLISTGPPVQNAWFTPFFLRVQRMVALNRPRSEIATVMFWLCPRNTIARGELPRDVYPA